ncbi:MAG TPA: NAD(P)H-dependent oxidoreductase [Candidatus Paceibacterota bacterium]|nr:NAD(P)H-dependent oxidoreductase [Candidatus Paceibacterota bacterium]
MRTFLVFSGSLRKDSYNTALARAFVDRAPEDTTLVLGDIQFPLYNQDLEVSFPEEVSRVKADIRNADGVILVTPEHNRSTTAALKNFIDWTSRPYGDNAWVGKPVFIAGASVGNISTALAQYELKKILLYLDARVLGQPEFYVGFAQDKVQDGRFVDEDTLAHIDKALAAFTTFAS